MVPLLLKKFLLEKKFFFSLNRRIVVKAKDSESNVQQSKQKRTKGICPQKVLSTWAWEITMLVL